MKDCPHCLDIWRLTAEQREKLIEDLMALKDAVEEEEVCSAPEEGFVRATRHKTPGESSVILQSVVMIQLTSRRILRD